jgi:hypothetical protein
MRRLIFSKSTFAAVLLGCFLLFATTSHADISSDSQVQCLTSLARFEGINTAEASLQRAMEENHTAIFSFSQLEKDALNDGMKVVDQQISFSALRKMDAPAIARLNNPDELITIAAIGKQNAIIYEGATLRIISVNVLSQRYDGEALLYEHYLHQRPQIKVDEPVRDVNINMIGGAFPFSVPLKNIGNDIITLRVQSTSCGCTSDDQSVQTLKPGQNGELHFKTTANTDRVVTAMIATSDPAKPVFVLAFQITAPKTTIQPVSGVLLNGDIGKEIQASFPLTLPPGVSVAKLTSSQPFVTAKLLGVSQQGNNNISQVGVTVKPNAPAGPFSDGITVLLKGGDIKSVTVPVEGYINTDVYFTPAMVSLDKMKPGSTSSYQVILQSPIHKKFAITDWQTNNTAIEMQAQRNVKSDVQHIVVQVHAPQDTTMLNGRITFTLSDGRQINLDVIGQTSN